MTKDVSSTLELHLTTTTVSDMQQCDILMAFPNAFSVSRAPKSSLWSKTKLYHLRTPDAPQLYTCQEVVPWSGKITISLHTGSTAESDPIASSASKSAWRTDTTVTIPISAISTTSSSTSGEIKEPFRRYTSLTHETWDFVCPIGYDGEERQVEKFEWRRSHGDETASLRDGKSTRGWKLIRLHSESNVVSPDSKVSGHSSDGKEIVALWTDDSLTWFRGVEKGVVGKFAFIGSGADGGLGEQWKLFVVVSAMHMRQVGLRQAQSTGSSASVSA
jgi:hypothetical protein